MSIAKQIVLDGSKDFSLVSGDNARLIFVVRGPSGDIADISGTTVRWAMTRSANGLPLVVKPGTVIDGPGGLFRVTIDPADTANLKGVFVHEAELEGHSTIATVAQAKATILPDPQQVAVGARSSSVNATGRRPSRYHAH